MNIEQLLKNDYISMDLQSADKYQAIEELLNLLAGAGKIKNRDEALQDLVEREQYLSTGLENGLAVPHAKTNAVTELLLAFGISKKGIKFDSLDGKPVHFVFLVLSPRDTSGPHIRMLAQITRIFRNNEIGQRLLQASHSDQVREILITPAQQNI